MNPFKTDETRPADAGRLAAELQELWEKPTTGKYLYVARHAREKARPGPRTAQVNDWESEGGATAAASLEPAQTILAPHQKTT